jgi:hypothetical protein
MSSTTEDVYTGNKSDSSLISEAKRLHSAINVMCCFSAGDLMLFGAICSALELRGYDIQFGETFVVEKKEEANCN